MHIPDGYLTSELALAADAVALVALGAAAVAVRRQRGACGGGARAVGGARTDGAIDGARERLAAAPLVGAAVFAAQMLNVHVGGGTSGHLVGAVIACLLLGAPLGFLTIAVVLAAQALAFADGGLLAYGANVLVMGGAGAVAATAADRLSRVGAGAASSRAAVPHRRAGRIAAAPRALPRPLAGALTAVVALLGGAVAVGALVELSGTAPEAIAAMARTHVPIALVEGAVTAVVLALAGARERIPRGREPAATGAAVAATLALVALAPLASSAPDGLERVAHDLGFAAQASAEAEFAPAAGYAAPGIGDAAAATVAAGLLGVALVALALAGVARAAGGRGSAAAIREAAA